MKNILCMIGFHQPDRYRYLVVRRHRGRHKWHRNYVVCRRCGKLIRTFSVQHKREDGRQ